MKSNEMFSGMCSGMVAIFLGFVILLQIECGAQVAGQDAIPVVPNFGLIAASVENGSFKTTYQVQVTAMDDLILFRVWCGVS